MVKNTVQPADPFAFVSQVGLDEIARNRATHLRQQEYLEQNSVYMFGACETEVSPTRSIGKGHEKAGIKKSHRRFACLQ
jgi:hypothetical protein